MDPRALKRREVNARFMEPGQFARLVENFRIDGRMTGVVTVAQNDDGALEILSGHHRTEAAIVADFAEIEVIVIKTPLSEARKTAIQLSHNSISGQDNQSLLAQMYEGLDLDAKKFSGLTDDVLAGLGALSTLSVGSLTTEYEELRLSFLPEDREKLDRQLARLKGSAKAAAYAARLEDFDTLFDVLVRAKTTLNILNNALAILMMSELAAERLDQIEAEANPPSAPNTETSADPSTADAESETVGAAA